MSCRIEGGVLNKHWYGNANRLESIKQYAGSDCADPGTLQQTWSFYYDGDGNRVKEEYIVDGVVMYTRHLLGGGAYEFTDDGTDITTRQYYNVGGMMVAMKEWVNESSKTTNYFASDHLSSTSLVMDENGALLSENRYMPFGETRTISGTTNITETDFGYTGQRDYSDDFGLMDYKARFYSPALGRFTQPDSVVPQPGNSQAWNRYSYTLNNPVKYNDPTGHTASGGGYGGMEPDEPDEPDGECTDSAECDLEGGDNDDKPMVYYVGDTIIVIMPPGSDPTVERPEWLELAGEILHVLGWGADMVEWGMLFDPLISDEDWVAAIDVGLTTLGSFATGESYLFESPHPDVPIMIGVSQDVMVTAGDFGIAAFTKYAGAATGAAAGAAEGGPGGAAAGGLAGYGVGWTTDVITTGGSLVYDTQRVLGDLPNHVTFGISVSLEHYNEPVIIVWPQQ